MRTVGVDLSAQPKDTAVATIEWQGAGAEVVDLVIGADDRRVCDLASGADKTGIDSPFGWPSTFVDFLLLHRARHSHDTQLDSVDHRRPLLLRQTDFHVKARTHLNPLSVAAEKIAIVAMRCAGLLQLMSVTDRVNGPVVEVYPAAALACWSLPHRGYKGDKGFEVRSHLLWTLQEAAPLLEFGAYSEACEASDHAFDAVVSAIVAYAAAVGRTIQPSVDQAEVVDGEGWIHLPDIELPQLLGSDRS